MESNNTVTKTFKVKGMHCASCAFVIDKTLSSQPHVASVSVNYASEKAIVSFDESKTNINTMNSSIEKLGYSLVSPDEPKTSTPEDSEHVDFQNKVYFLLFPTLTVFFLMLWDIASTLDGVPNMPIPMPVFNLIGLALSSVVLLWVGRQYAAAVVRFIQYRVANMDTLVGIGTFSAYIYSLIVTLFPFLKEYLNLPEYTYFDVTIVVLGFMTIGKYLEAKSKRRTGDAIAKLLNLQSKTALVIKDGKETEIPIMEVVHNDVVVIKPGSRIPVDGEVLEGSSYVDESLVTGEPMPVLKKSGDGVLSGTINTTGSFTLKATKIGSETLLAQIVKMVEEAQGSKAPIQALADKVSSYFVPVVLIIAFTSLFGWLVVGSYYIGFSQAISLGLMSFVGVLVVACPCALGLATPTAITVGVGKGAQEGILIKDAATLEKLHSINTLLIDKTGTLTQGRPSISDVVTLADVSSDEMLSILASVEQKSEHPIAHAVMQYAKTKSLKLHSVAQFESIPGKGVRGVVEGTMYVVGSVSSIHALFPTFDKNVLERYTMQGKTPVVVATNDKVLGFVVIEDEIKKESKDAVSMLKKMGITVVMVTGDDDKTAKYIAGLVGIDKVYANILPQDKLEVVKKLQDEKHIVAMAGDGVNDAPALAAAHVGIAMSTGTDVAIESAGITLLGGDISKLVKAIRLSKITMRGIKQNLFWAFIYNILGIPLAAGAFYPLFGWVLNPVFAGFAMAMSSVSVVGNSLRIRSIKI